MRLSYDMTNKSESVAAKALQKFKGMERRAFVRLPCSLTSSGHAIPSRAEDLWTAQVWDVSQGGLSLRTDRPFDRGTLLGIELEERLQGARPTLFVRVVRATEEPGAGWVLGCRFVNKLSDAELQALAQLPL
jgi:hypothetical protein